VYGLRDSEMIEERNNMSTFRQIKMLLLVFWGMCRSRRRSPGSPVRSITKKVLGHAGEKGQVKCLRPPTLGKKKNDRRSFFTGKKSQNSSREGQT